MARFYDPSTGLMVETDHTGKVIDVQKFIVGRVPQIAGLTSASIKLTVNATAWSISSDVRASDGAPIPGA
jgi:hypothetical protein